MPNLPVEPSPSEQALCECLVTRPEKEDHQKARVTHTAVLLAKLKVLATHQAARQLEEKVTPLAL